MDILDTFFNWTVFQDSLPLLLLGLTTTLSLGVTSILIGLVTGLFLALIRMYAPAPVALLAVAYIDLFRAIPILVLLVLIYYALPFVGLRLSPFAAATSALSLVSCAYSDEGQGVVNQHQQHQDRNGTEQVDISDRQGRERRRRVHPDQRHEQAGDQPDQDAGDA